MTRMFASNRAGTYMGLQVLLLIIVALAGCAPESTQPQPTAPGELSSVLSEVPRATEQPIRDPTAMAEEPSPSQAPQLTFAVPDDPATIALAQGLIDAYQDTSSTVSIELQPLPAKDYLRVLVDGSRGRAYDLILTTDVQAPTLMDNAILLDIQPLLAQRVPLEPDDFYPEALAPWERSWSRYGLPISATPQVLFYNKALFDARGEPYPTAEWTWQDWFASARRLAETEGAQPQIYGLSIGGWTTIVWGNGGELLNPDNTRTLLDQPEAAEGVQRFADLVADGVAPHPTSIGGPEPAVLFTEQQVAMIPAPSSLAARLAQDLPFEWGVVPVPAGPTRAVLLSVSGLAVGAESQSPQAAFEFITWATGNEGQALRAQLQPYIPQTLKELSAPPGDTPAHQLIREAVQHGRTLPGTAKWPAVADLVNTALAPVWTGDQQASVAYQEVAPKINALLAPGTSEAPGALPEGQVASISTTGSPVAAKETATIVPIASPKDPATAVLPTATARPTPASRLHFVKLNENDDPSCISVGIKGVRTQGWTFVIDGMRLSGTFDGGGNARLCGLAPRQEVTFTVRDSRGQIVPGGRGVPAIGSAIMSAEWR